MVQEVVPAIRPISTTTAYTVKKDDTISGVAVRYGLRWQDVVAVNPGISPNKLQVGQVIQLPGQVDLSKSAAAHHATTHKPAAAPVREETVYVVKSGDSLSGIAVKHGVKVSDIQAANSLKNADKITVGQKLKIPGATKSTVTVPPVKTTPPKGNAPVPPTPTTPKPTIDAVVPAGGNTLAPVPPIKDAGAQTNPAAAKEPAKVADAVTPPTPVYQKHTVKAGEDAYAVAIRWGVSPSDIQDLNKLPSTELKEGQVLLIPDSPR